MGKIVRNRDGKEITKPIIVLPARTVTYYKYTFDITEYAQHWTSTTSVYHEATSTYSCTPTSGGSYTNGFALGGSSSCSTSKTPAYYSTETVNHYGDWFLTEAEAIADGTNPVTSRVAHKETVEYWTKEQADAALAKYPTAVNPVLKTRTVNEKAKRLVRIVRKADGKMLTLAPKHTGSYAMRFGGTPGLIGSGGVAGKSFLYNPIIFYKSAGGSYWTQAYYGQSARIRDYSSVGESSFSSSIHIAESLDMTLADSVKVISKYKNGDYHGTGGWVTVDSRITREVNGNIVVKIGSSTVVNIPVGRDGVIYNRPIDAGWAMLRIRNDSYDKVSLRIACGKGNDTAGATFIESIEYL